MFNIQHSTSNIQRVVVGVCLGLLAIGAEGQQVVRIDGPVNVNYSGTSTWAAGSATCNWAKVAETATNWTKAAAMSNHLCGTVIPTSTVANAAYATTAGTVTGGIAYAVSAGTAATATNWTGAAAMSNDLCGVVIPTSTVANAGSATTAGSFYPGEASNTLAAAVTNGATGVTLGFTQATGPDAGASNEFTTLHQVELMVQSEQTYFLVTNGHPDVAGYSNAPLSNATNAQQRTFAGTGANSVTLSRWLTPSNDAAYTIDAGQRWDFHADLSKAAPGNGGVYTVLSVWSNGTITVSSTSEVSQAIGTTTEQLDLHGYADTTMSKDTNELWLVEMITTNMGGAGAFTFYAGPAALSHLSIPVAAGQISQQLRDYADDATNQLRVYLTGTVIPTSSVAFATSAGTAGTATNWTQAEAMSNDICGVVVPTSRVAYATSAGTAGNATNLNGLAASSYVTNGGATVNGSAISNGAAITTVQTVILKPTTNHSAAATTSTYLSQDNITTLKSASWASGGSAVSNTIVELGAGQYLINVHGSLVQGGTTIEGRILMQSVIGGVTSLVAFTRIVPASAVVAIPSYNVAGAYVSSSVPVGITFSMYGSAVITNNAAVTTFSFQRQ